MFRPSTNKEHVVLSKVMNTNGLSKLFGLRGSKTLRNLFLNPAQVVTTSHLEVTAISPGCVPRVSECPIILATVSSPSNHLDTVSTNNATRLRCVDSLRVKREIGVEVGVHGKASLKRTIVVQLGLVKVEVRVSATQGLVRSTIISRWPLGTRIAGSLMTFGGLSISRVIRLAAREALRVASCTSALDQIVPSSFGVSSVTSL
mmetsp:Transcript_9114/g.12225  ORF Transcript_9114/g.12225 Transcript_9114/m.12225 type:complete len:203 (+) Transcript_9114:325-933(+)